MNYFDRRLESQLRGMLDPIVNTQAPARRRRSGGKTVQVIQVLELPPLTPAAVPVDVFA